jgi:hypothetical protein
VDRDLYAVNRGANEKNVWEYEAYYKDEGKQKMGNVRDMRIMGI